jgi:nicotinate-nucleotide pyrophosphorylase (carboxylating)
MVMLKDNHIDGELLWLYLKQKSIFKKIDLKLLVEARDIDEVKEIIVCEGVYRTFR